MTGSRQWLRWLGLLSLLLLVPLVPFLVLGDTFEARVQEWVQRDWSPESRFWLIVLVLSADILLPIPSSGVSTFAGGTLGLVWGTIASWLGMTLGATIGYALARLLGRPFAERFGGADVQRLRAVTERYGDAALVITRPLPLVAEACVLLTGTMRLSWRRFLPPVLLSNLAISLTYAAFGTYFGGRDALAPAIIASVLLPLTVALLVRRKLRTLD